MGNKLFGLDIAAIVNGAMGSGLPDVTLVKVTSGGRDPADPTSQLAETTANKAAKGFIENYSEEALTNTSIRRTDRLISVLGDSIADGAVPQMGDRLVAEGTTWEIVSVPGRDPAGAVYLCQAR